ncbi:MAG: Yip1 family protein [Candidatus Micrarchaeota archaeon]
MAEKADDKKDGKKEDRKEEKEDKKAKQKEIISKLAKEEPAPEIPPEKSVLNKKGISKISVNFSFELDKAAKNKLPFLIAVLLLSTFSFIMFAKTGFSFNDIFDFSRVSNNIDKIFSIAFILFFLLYALSMAFAMFFGFNIRSTNAFAFSTLIIIPVIIGYLVDSRYLLAYVYLGFSLMLTSLFGTVLANLSTGEIYKRLGQMLLVMALVAVLFTAVKVSGDRDSYYELFISNVAKLTPMVQGQFQGSLADAIRETKIEDSKLDEISSDPSKYLKPDDVKPLVKAQYAYFRAANINAFTNAEEKKYADGVIPKTYDLLDSSSQLKLRDDTYAFFKTPEGVKILSSPFKQAWPELKEELALLIEEKPEADLNDQDLVAIRKKLDEMPFFNDFKNRFEIFVALLIFSVLSLANMILKLFATGFCYLISRII